MGFFILTVDSINGRNLAEFRSDFASQSSPAMRLYSLTKVRNLHSHLPQAPGANYGSVLLFVSTVGKVLV